MGSRNAGEEGERRSCRPGESAAVDGDPRPGFGGLVGGVEHPEHVEGERYVGEAVELIGEPDDARALDGRVEKDGYEIGWNRVFERDPDGGWAFAYDHPNLGDDERSLAHGVFDALAERTDSRVGEIEEEFHRKHRYVRYMRQEELTDFETLFRFLSDLRNDEAATVERIANDTA